MIRFLGSKVNVRARKSTACADAFGKIVAKSLFLRKGSARRSVKERDKEGGVKSDFQLRRPREEKGILTIARSTRAYCVKLIQSWCAENFENQSELMVICYFRGACENILLADQIEDRGSLQSRPGKSGRPLSISAKMHPVDQISIPFVYCLNLHDDGITHM